MAGQYDNKVIITQGRKLQNQQPIVDTFNFSSVADVQNGLTALDGAAIWYDGMPMVLKSENSQYTWLDEAEAATNQRVDMASKLLSVGFTYPEPVPVYGDRTFNFFKLFDETIEDGFFELIVTSGSTLWTANHNMGKEPSVQCFNEFGERIFGQVAFPSLNQTTVFYSSPVRGKMLLN